MRTRILHIFLFLPVFLCAQQWRPVNSSEQFNFRIDTADFISHVISVDSVSLAGGDSVFHFNRVVTKCWNCSNPEVYLCNQPQFLEKEMVALPGGVCFFNNPGGFVLKSLAEVGDSWLFDTTAAVTAQVTGKSFQMIFGQWDSVKTITLSSGQSIQLSKNNGIIAFPVFGQNSQYLLEGIAGRNTGILLPGFMEIYDFQPGDVFQYRFKQISLVIGGGSVALVKKRVLSRDSTALGYSYEIEKLTMSWPESMNGIPGPVSHHYDIFTSYYTDSDSNICNYYPGRMVMDPLHYDDDFVSFMTITPDTGQVISRIVGAPDNFLYYNYGTDTLFRSYAALFSDKYSTGLGAVAYIEDGFEWYTHNLLIGYVKNGDTTGIVYPDDFILENVAQTEREQSITVFPIPAHNKVNLRLQDSNSRIVSLEVYSSDGRKMPGFRDQDLAESVGVDVSALLPGMYHLVVKTTGNVIHQKILIE